MPGKPIKRNGHLVILSREHHLGLLFAWKLRQGLKGGIAPTRIAEYVSYFWAAHLMEHFLDEERLLFRHVQDPLVNKAMEQHMAIGILINQLLAGERDDAELYGRLADIITDHIRFEERELFPHLELILTPDQLSGIGTGLTRRHREPKVDDYPDEFWLNVKTRDDNKAHD